MKLFQQQIRFVGHNIHQGTITPIQRVLEFTKKFPDEVTDKKAITKIFRMS